jgi:hypothetical protein
MTDLPFSVPVEANAPECSATQRSIWFMEQLHPRTPAYNLSLTLRIDGPLDVLVLRRCLSEIVHRHSVLRTSFPTVDGRPQPAIAGQLALPVPLTDLSGQPDADAQVMSLAGREAYVPFDLEHGPLVRARVIRVAKDRHVLCWTAHHIVSDGWSNWLIVRELVKVYPALLAGQPCPLPLPALQFWEYASWQRDRLQTAVLERELAYWRRTMASMPPISTFPPDAQRPGAPVFHGARHSYVLSGQLSSAIKELARRERATPFMVLLAALQALLCRYSGQDDVVIGVPTGGRVQVEFEELVGPFANTLPVRVTLAGNMSFRELLRRARAATIEASQHQEVPFDRLVEELCPRRQASVHPLYQVMLAMLETPSAVPVLPAGLQVTSMTLPVPVDQQLCTALLDLTLCLNCFDDQYAGHLEYNAALFHRDTVVRLLECYTGILERVVMEPELRLTELLPVTLEAPRPPTVASGLSRPGAIDLALRALAARRGGTARA